MTRRINAGEGSLGKLLKDDSFSRSLTCASTDEPRAADRDGINRGEGTVGKLMTDPALFNRLNSVTRAARPAGDPAERGRGDGGAVAER